MNIVNNDSAILSAVAKQVVPIRGPSQEQDTKIATPPQMTWALPGFFGKSKVQTSFGSLPIEALRRRDQLRTIAGSYVEVDWVDQIRLDVAFLEQHPEAQPIYIPKGAFGTTMPNQNMLVSPAQSIKPSGQIGDDGVYSALDLTARPNITRMPHSGFTYYLFHCGVPAVINVDGMWVGTSPI
jgi:hypothetical protein